jgi:hypothetical protein
MNIFQTLFELHAARIDDEYDPRNALRVNYDELFRRDVAAPDAGGAAAAAPAADGAHGAAPIYGHDDHGKRRMAGLTNSVREYRPPPPDGARGAQDAGDAQRQREIAEEDGADFGGQPGLLPNDCAGHRDYQSLNAAQRNYVDTVLRAVLRRGEDDAQLLYWLDGAAGCGKTFATRILVDTVRGIAGRRDAVLTCAFQGNAACNLELGARTIHSAFGIKIFGGAAGADDRRGARGAADTLRVDFPRLQLVVIDEISMVASDMFAHVEAKLRSTFDAERPFGGVVVVAIGDFLQLPPVKGLSVNGGVSLWLTRV